MAEQRGVFWDFHGVLADDGGARKAARHTAFGVLAEKYDDERFLQVPQAIHERAHLMARSTEGIIGYVLREAGLVPPDSQSDHPLVVETANLQRAFYRREAAKGVDAIPGAVELVHHARACFGPDNVAIVTGGRAWEVKAFLDRHDLNVGVVVTKEDTLGQKKPHPLSYQLALQETGLDASDVVAVEDSEHGLLAARQAEIGTRLGLPTRRTPDVLMQAGATAIAKSMEEVRTHLSPMVDALL